jgi:DNA-binding XRE family transcriptional regulator
MDQRIKTYVRPLRRRWGLTQKELAFIIGAKSGTVVSRIEGVKRTPNVATVLACALVFDVAAPVELFPVLVSQIHENVRRRVNELYEELQGNPNKLTRKKLDFFEAVLARLEADDTANGI